MNNPFEYIPDREAREAFHNLILRIGRLKESSDREDLNFCRELEQGKMLGVLIAVDKEGARHQLFAFSGQLGDCGFHFPGFVGPIFDYLQPDGHFKTKEAEISRLNQEIRDFETAELPAIRIKYGNEKSRLDALLAEAKEEYRRSKTARDLRRTEGELDAEVEAALIRKSQFEKAELRRLKQRLQAQLQPLADEFQAAQSRLDSMKQKRRADSEALQQWLFSNFRVRNARGEERSLLEIFAETPLKTPPSGAGECCAPKLLQAAYLRGWTPVLIAEFWYGQPKSGEIRIHGEHYPACRGKCLPVLSWMLLGLEVSPPLETSIYQPHPDPEILYENRWFCVINKPSGMLSVPGKGAAISVQEWLTNHYGSEREVRMVHRLDQDTSGLLIAAFGELSYKILQRLFAMRQVRKTYIAELDGNYMEAGIPSAGQILLPISPDWLDRPRQRIDFEQGKEAITDYEFTGFQKGRSRVIFRPRTGRTHQLRVHAASSQGLGMPIAGDRLYGKNGGKDAPRLLLHAHRLEFTFPIDRQHYTFESPLPF